MVKFDHLICRPTKNACKSFSQLSYSRFHVFIDLGNHCQKYCQNFRNDQNTKFFERKSWPASLKVDGFCESTRENLIPDLKFIMINETIFHFEFISIFSQHRSCFSKFHGFCKISKLFKISQMRLKMRRNNAETLYLIIANIRLLRMLQILLLRGQPEVIFLNSPKEILQSSEWRVFSSRAIFYPA